MTNLPAPIRPLLVLAATALFAIAVSACGTTTASVDNGRVLFIERCGTCHTLAEAGTTAEIGPNLDDAFAAARAAGEESETFEGVVKAQVEYPRPSNGDASVSMPADVVEGQDLEDVAAYVGKWAGVPGAAPPTVPGGPGAQVFANNGCGGCHTLAAAKSGGQVGPNLDEVLSGQSSGDDRRIDRRPERQDRDRLPGKRDAAELRRKAQPQRTRRPGPVPIEETGGEGAAPQGKSGEGGLRSRSPPDRSPTAAEPPLPRPPPAVGIIFWRCAHDCRSR